MPLCRVARTLLFVFFLISKADASSNATATPAHLATFPSTANQPGTLLSDPPNARDEERAPGIENIGLGTKLATLLTKIKQAVFDSIVKTHLMLKLRWWRRNSVDPYIVFTNLKLDQDNENILLNVRFRAWVKYVDSYNSEHPEEEVSIFAKLWERFDEHKLAMMLEQAKNEAKSSIRALGTRLQRDQMSFWREVEYNPRVLYRILQLTLSHPTLLTGHAYNVWNIYFSEYVPGRSMKHLEQLLHTFDDASLSSLLIASKSSKETATLATNLQLELEKFWLRKDEAPELVFKYLMLDKTPYDVLDNPELKSWMRYAQMYREKTGKDVTLDEIIVSLIETDIMKVIIRTAEAEGEKKLAENLEKKLAEKLAAASA